MVDRCVRWNRYNSESNTDNIKLQAHMFFLACPQIEQTTFFLEDLQTPNFGTSIIKNRNLQQFQSIWLNRSSRVWLLCMVAPAESSSDQNSWKQRKYGGLKGQCCTETCLKLPTFDWKKETPKDLLFVVLLSKDWKKCCEHVRNSVESRQEAYRPITFQLKIATANRNLHLAQCLLKENVFRKLEISSKIRIRTFQSKHQRYRNTKKKL